LDGSEKIRYSEFLAATIEASGTINEMKLAEAFDRLDSDDSGFISVENLLEILGDTFTKEDVEAIINEVNVTNGQISYSEFLSLWESTENDDDDDDDEMIEGLSGNGFVTNTIHEEPNGVIKTVQINSSKNPFLDSERSTGAISTLSNDFDDHYTAVAPKATTIRSVNETNEDDNMDDPGNVSRFNFLQGKMMSERNMIILEQAKKQTYVSVQ
jgi:Ca2+-binding EF-hand superfamily protein